MPRPRATPTAGDAMHWIVRIATHHPDDPLVAAPLFLRLVQPRTRPGPVHRARRSAQLPGRRRDRGDGQLRQRPSPGPDLQTRRRRRTARHPRLRSLRRRPAGAPSRRTPLGHTDLFPAAAEDFRLDVLQIDGTDEAPLKHQGRARITLALEGEIEVRNSLGTETLRPGQGRPPASSRQSRHRNRPGNTRSDDVKQLTAGVGRAKTLYLGPLRWPEPTAGASHRQLLASVSEGRTGRAPFKSQPRAARAFWPAFGNKLASSFRIVWAIMAGKAGRSLSGQRRSGVGSGLWRNGRPGFEPPQRRRGPRPSQSCEGKAELSSERSTALPEGA